MSTEHTIATSRLERFYERTVDDRRALIGAAAGLSAVSLAQLASREPLPLATADRMIENVVGVHGLPLGIALNFRLNGRDFLVPMAVEEPSIVAAASHAARIVRGCGGFSGEAGAAVMTAQIQLDDVPDCAGAASRIAAVQHELLRAADAAVPSLLARGGGCRGIETRVLDADLGVAVIHLYVDVGEAMGANIVDSVAEAVAPLVHAALGGRMGLRILSNLPIRRRIRVTARVTEEAIGGAALADGIARASRFASLDPYRAATHNKGVLNGIDSVAVALGQDWRAIEAGAHSFAAMGGRYGPLATWTHAAGMLVGVLDMPLAAATVGGALTVHPGVKACLEIVRVSSARELALVMGAAGLATNLAALRALAGEGIQRGHMRLHRRKHEAAESSL